MTSPNALPAQRCVHIGIVVRDARRSAAHYARILGAHRWSVMDCDARRVTNAAVRGTATEQSFRLAQSTVQNTTGDITFHLIEPRGGWTTAHEFLYTRGEGIHHICTGVLTPDKFTELQPWLDRQGVGVLEDVTLDQACRYVTLNTQAQLGVRVQLLVTADPARTLRADEVWDFSESAADDEPLLPVQNLRPHFGVVVGDVIACVEHWRRLLGIQRADFKHWSTGEPGSLRDTVNMGAPVDHAYFATILRPAPDLGFELIQPTRGPSHYKEQFLQRVGEGIHHVYLSRFETPQDCNLAIARANEYGCPVVMGGEVGDRLARFYYIDTTQTLGFVSELTHPEAGYALHLLPTPTMSMVFDSDPQKKSEAPTAQKETNP